MKQGENIQAVILAAGKGTRMLPLTETCPKPLQMVSGKNLMEWKLEALPDGIEEVIVVIGYQGEQIQEYFGDIWRKKNIRYVTQHELNGTAGALWAAQELLQKKFLVMMGDDLYGKEDILHMLEHDWAIGAQAITKREIGGEILANSDGMFVGIHEPKHFVEQGFMNTGLYMLSPRLFEYDPVSLGRSPVEYGLPQTLALLAKKIPVAMVPATKWLQVTTPEDLQKAEKFISMNT